MTRSGEQIHQAISVALDATLIDCRMALQRLENMSMPPDAALVINMAAAAPSP
jgi:hypothetical protein